MDCIVICWFNSSQLIRVDKFLIIKNTNCNVRAAECTRRFNAKIAHALFQGRGPGVLESPFWVMKMKIISRGKTYRNPPFEILREEIFVFEEEPKKINLKMHRTLYRRLRLDGSCEPPVHRSLQCGNQQLSQPHFQLCARRD